METEHSRAAVYPTAADASTALPATLGNHGRYVYTEWYQKGKS